LSWQCDDASIITLISSAAIDFRYSAGRRVVSLQSKKIKALHENDFIMATKIDQIFASAAIIG
jgi:hypothetical protein